MTTIRRQSPTTRKKEKTLYIVISGASTLAWLLTAWAQALPTEVSTILASGTLLLMLGYVVSESHHVYVVEQIQAMEERRRILQEELTEMQLLMSLSDAKDLPSPPIHAEYAEAAARTY